MGLVWTETKILEDLDFEGDLHLIAHQCRNLLAESKQSVRRCKEDRTFSESSEERNAYLISPIDGR